eukprot:Skav209773  [mRNA]  locus=scaffold9:431259:433841:- [translate_table: standard]
MREMCTKAVILCFEDGCRTERTAPEIVVLFTTPRSQVPFGIGREASAVSASCCKGLISALLACTGGLAPEGLMEK